MPTEVSTMRRLVRKRWTTVFSVGLAGCVAAALLALASCTPGSEITVQESDVVATLYDSNVNFGAIKTFAMPDSIVALDSPDTPREDTSNDDEILSLIAANLETRGYTRVEESSPTPPDVMILVGVTTGTQWYYDSYYPWYPGWGWYGGWSWWGYWGAGYGGYYPPYGGVSYAYSTGTLLVAMADPNEANIEDKTIPVYWFGAINGVLDDTKASLENRVEDSINQMFQQSPYLKSES
jgi:hypothetical protein